MYALPNMESLQTSRKWVLEKLEKNLLESSKEKEKKENKTALATSPIKKKTQTMQCMRAILFCVLLSFKMKLRLMVVSTAEGSLQS